MLSLCCCHDSDFGEHGFAKKQFTPADCIFG
jgi:hypothetical protein